MKKSANKTMMVLLLIFLSVQSNAQKEALWKLDFESEVVWNKSIDNGILLVGTRNFKLYGVDSNTGKLLWTSIAFKQAKRTKGPNGKKVEAKYAYDNFIRTLSDDENPQISDFIELKFSDPSETFKQYAIINMKTGKEVISPKMAGFKISKTPLFGEVASFNYYGTGYIPSLKLVILSSTYYDLKKRSNVNVTKMYDLVSQKLLWTNNNVSINSFPAVLENGDVVLSGKTQIVRLNSQTGQAKWTYNTSKNNQFFESFDLSLDLSNGYFFEKKNNRGTLSAIDIQSGKKLWEQDLKLKVVPRMSAMRDGVVVIDEKWFTMYDLKNGSQKWRAKKINGYVVDLGEQGILATAKEKQLMLLNGKDGSVIWDKKIKGINIDQMGANGIMYTDSKGRLGYIKYNGELIWNKKGMLEVPTLRYKPELGKELMLIDKHLYEVDLYTGDYKVLYKDLTKRFEGGKDAAPSNIELVAGGYLISDANNLIMLEKNGKERFKKYWEAPGMSLAAKIALRAAQAAVLAMAAANSAQSSQIAYNSRYGYNDYYSKMYAKQAENLSKASGQIGAEARKKFKASKSKGNYRVILSRVGEGSQTKSAGLVKVDKRTGEELGRLLLGDKKPIYDFDPISGQVFFKSDKKQIVSYKF